ncbi:MAG: DUF1512 domain-containing protein [Thermoproteota archaeon]|nr:DUF1512 domain-containing protein [Thermoproteota archaeon]
MNKNSTFSIGEYLVMPIFVMLRRFYLIFYKFLFLRNMFLTKKFKKMKYNKKAQSQISTSIIVVVLIIAMIILLFILYPYFPRAFPSPFNPTSSNSSDALVYLFYLFWIFFLLFGMMAFLMPGFQLSIARRSILNRIQGKLRILDALDNRAKKILAEQLKKYGGNVEELKDNVKEIVEYFEIDPVERDPSGILNRLEYILDVTKYRFQTLIKTYAPKVNKDELDSLSDTAAVALVIHLLNKQAKHWYLLAEKYKNYYLAVQLEFLMPIILDLARSFLRAIPATTMQIPIGDGIGPLVIARMYKDLGVTQLRNVGNDMILGEAIYQNRKLLLMKAKGPASRVGKPGAAVRQIMEELQGKVDLIVTIDAALKYEGEETGSIAQGVGAAIGDPGPEKFKIEESAMKYRIPLLAIIIKQSFAEAVSPMLKVIAEKADVVVEKVKKLVIETVPEGGTALIIGIGNTLGIGEVS